MKRHWLWLAVVLLTVSPIRAMAEPVDPLLQVIHSIPRTLQPASIAVTNWDAIKAATGKSELTSESPMSERMDFLLSLDDGAHANATGFGLSMFESHAEWWGFDTTDLVWEAQVVALASPSIYILKLRQDFDMTLLTARLNERGFVQTHSYGGAIFSRSVNPNLAWVRTTELSIHNTGVLAERRLLICSSAYSLVEAVLATQSGVHDSMAIESYVSELLEDLTGVFSAYLLIGDSTCLRFSPHPLTGWMGTDDGSRAMDELRAWLDSGKPLHAYHALGVGYRHDNGIPIGTLTFVYPSLSDAEADLFPRRLLAEAGLSALTERPISETMFLVQGAEVDERLLRLTIQPLDNLPRRLFQMLIYQDAIFAACR